MQSDLSISSKGQVYSIISTHQRWSWIPPGHWIHRRGSCWTSPMLSNQLVAGELDKHVQGCTVTWHYRSPWQSPVVHLPALPRSVELAPGSSPDPSPASCCCRNIQRPRLTSIELPPATRDCSGPYHMWSTCLWYRTGQQSPSSGKSGKRGGWIVLRKDSLCEAVERLQIPGFFEPMLMGFPWMDARGLGGGSILVRLRHGRPHQMSIDDLLLNWF